MSPGERKEGEREDPEEDALDAEPANAEPANAEPANAEPANAEPANAEPANAEPANAEAILSPQQASPFSRLMTQVFALRVEEKTDFIIPGAAANESQTNKLYLSMAPGKVGGKSGHRRDLLADLQEIKEKGIIAIFCLQEWGEMWSLGLGDYPRLAQEAGFLFYHLPVKDGSVPSSGDLKIFLRNINSELTRGDVLVHCRCGLGRAGTIAACFLIMYGEDWRKALFVVRGLREGAVQTKEQEKFIRKFKI